MKFASIAFGLLLLVVGTRQATAGVLYGVDFTDGIWKIDTDAKTSTLVFDTNLSGQNNSAGFDGQRGHLFFMNRNTAGTPTVPATDLTLQYWNSATNTFSQIANNTQLGFNDNPANGAYYQNALWVIRQGTNTLSRIALNYSSGNPSFGGVTNYSVTNRVADQSIWGDIAITHDGMLYAWTSGQSPALGDFFRINLAAITGTTAPAVAIATDTGVGLQISFGGDSSTLYGHNTAGSWFTIDKLTGAVSPISGLSTVPFRDLAGANVPEPGTMVVAGMVTGGAWLRRLRRRKLAVAAESV